MTRMVRMAAILLTVVAMMVGVVALGVFGATTHEAICRRLFGGRTRTGIPSTWS